MPDKNSKLTGFTLIELLVTIAIIAILAAIGLIAYSTVLKQGRDAKRQADLRSIQSALEQYNSDQGFYPFTSYNAVSHVVGFDTRLNGTGAFTNAHGNPSAPTNVKTYIKDIPKDPAGSPRYQYLAIHAADTTKTCDNSTYMCTSYCLYTKLDSLTSADLKGCTDTTNTYNFALTPP